MLVDSDRAPEWVDSLTESKIIRQVGEKPETVHYDHIGTPFVLKDRDFVSDCKLEFDPARKNIILKISAVSDPLAPKTDYVRGELIHSSFALTSTDHGKRTPSSWPRSGCRSQRLGRSLDGEPFSKALAAQHHDPPAGPGRQTRHPRASSPQDRARETGYLD